MKGNPKVIKQLNERLADELAAINQYVVHAEMCANWGYARLHDSIQKRAVAEMKHAEALISRILFLDGTPVVNILSPIRIGATVATMIVNDSAAEIQAIRDYNADVKGACEAGDDGTRALLEGILKDEEEHLNDLEAQADQLQQMGLQNFLAEQTK